MSKTSISIRGLYKIFGTDPESVIEAVRNGLSKAELLEKNNHVLGLRNINLELANGQISVIMGLSGSGKSTLIRHLNRLIEPTVGEIEVEGQDIMVFDTLALARFRQRTMSMVFQKFALLPHQTVLQNAAMPLTVQGMSIKEAFERAQACLERVGLEGFEARYPAQLSGGMQQRVGLARALTADTPIMLMDEAFSALDPLIRNDMQDLLLGLQAELKKTIVFITHDLDEALKLADHLTILKDGGIVQQGDPQNILMHPADPYVADFVSHINRARVLRVRSLMQPVGKRKTESQVEAEETLENVLSRHSHQTDATLSVVQGGKTIGHLRMPDLIQALVPRHTE